MIVILGLLILIVTDAELLHHPLEVFHLAVDVVDAGLDAGQLDAIVADVQGGVEDHAFQQDHLALDGTHILQVQEVDSVVEVPGGGDVDMTGDAVHLLQHAVDDIAEGGDIHGDASLPIGRSGLA